MERTDFEQWKGKEVARLLALVETERRYYQEIVAGLPAGIAVLSAEREVVLANRAFRQMFGLRAEEIRRKTIEQLLPSDALIEKIRSVHLESSGEGRGMTLEYAGKLLRVDIRPMRSWTEDAEMETLIAIQEVSDPAARPVSATSIGQTPGAATPAAPVHVTPIDVPPIHIAPIHVGPIDASPQRPFAVPDVVAPSTPEFPAAELPAIVWQADAGTLRFAAVSGAISRLGFAPSHWLKTENFFERRILAEDRNATMVLFRSILESGGEASAEFRIVTASGESRWCRETVVVAAPKIAAASGKGSRPMYGVLTFIDERVRMQRQMEVASRHVALRAASARLAHDLNNPLMLIAGYAEEMLHAFPDGDPHREDAEQIVKATERIADLTARLLRFTRRGTTRPQSVDLSATVARLEPRFARICGNSVTVRTKADTRIWAVAESRALEEMLVAIAGAACAGSGCSEVRITCDTSTVAEYIPGATLAAGAYARVTVRGNGPGLEPGKSEALFESIFAGEALAYAYGLAQEWGGDIAYSGDASHSTFVLYLRPAEPTEERAQEISVVVPETPRPVIMVVDDEPGIRALVAKILRREQYEVIEASSATEASELAAAQTRPIELLVTDVMLPDQLGTSLAAQMREQLPAVKILYMSGYTDDERVRTGDFPQGAKFLQKPFTLGALVTKVRESLEQA